MIVRALIIFTCLFSISLTSLASPLLPIRANNPRDTMRTFMEAMNRYREGVETRDPKLQEDINRAVACLDLREIPYLLRKDTGKEAAILLKEVIDRVIIIDYARIPEEMNDKNFWRLKSTNIRIAKVDSGEHAGEWLFSPNTVTQARDFFKKVKNLPYLPASGQGANYQQPFLEKIIPSWAKNKNFGLYNWQWFGLLISLILGTLIRFLVSFGLALLKRGIDRTKTQWDNRVFLAVEKPLSLTAAALFWFIAVEILQLEGLFRQFALLFLQLLISVTLVRLAYLLSEIFCDYLDERAKRTDFPLDDQLMPLIRKTLKVSVVVLGTLIAIQNLGVNVLSLLAGLGLGGLALAMAAKDTAANLFGSIMIILDKPFKVGDYIICGDVEGTVEEIGFRSTRVRTFYNSEVSIPNAELANKNVDNMGKRKFRRIRTTLGLTYDTSPEKVQAFIDGVKNIILNNSSTCKENFEVCFYSYGDFSLNILLNTFLQVPDWSKEMQERQNIFLGILHMAKEIGVEFAFPTQTLHVDSLPQSDQNTPN